jgi:hypothetical protein
MLRDVLGSASSVAHERDAGALVERLLRDHERGRDRTPELWALLWLELWRREVPAAASPEEDAFLSSPAWASHAGP